MRLASYREGTASSFGLILGDDQILDLPAACHAAGRGTPQSLRSFINESADALGFLHACADPASRHVQPIRRVADVQLLPPVTDPLKIVAVGMNYVDHCQEQNVDPPKVPVLFAKFPTSLVGMEGEIRWDSSLTKKVDLEAELGVVIGRRAFRVTAEEAMDYVLGYTIVNDVTARDLQFGDGQWVRGKSLDTFCPVGPWIVTRDEIPDPHRLAISSTVNGRVWQNSSTAHMVFRIPQLVSFISQGITLEPGDLIATGTPAGVGVFRKPPLYLKDGDEVAIRIERIGELRNRCRCSV